MPRRIRKVPHDWVHPRDNANSLIPLQTDYKLLLDAWEKLQSEDGTQAALEILGNPPNKNEYMPEGEYNHMQMYTGVGIPCSPVFHEDQKKEMAVWLAKHKVPFYCCETADVKTWFDTITGQFFR